MKPRPAALLASLCLFSTALAQEPTAQTTRAITSGLKWLGEQQQKDGAVPTAKDRSAVAGTALAGLAWLGASADDRPSPHADAIKRALAYVLDHLGKATFTADWRKVDPNTLELREYGFALLFLATAWERRADAHTDAWRDAIAAAVKLVGAAQLKNGGWGDVPGSAADTITTSAIEFVALEACVRAGFEVDAAVLRQAAAYADGLTTDKGVTRYSSHSKEGEGDESLDVGAGGALLLAAGPKAERALDRLVRIAKSPRNEEEALLAFTALSRAGGARWAKAWPAESIRLLKVQLRTGGWAEGPLPTAFALLALELPHRSLSFALGDAEFAAVRCWRTLESAPSLTVVFNSTIGTKQLKGTYQSRGRDRWRLDLVLEAEGKSVEVDYRCDGKKFSVRNDGAWTAPEAVVEGMADYVRQVGVRAGFTHMIASLPLLGKGGGRFPPAEELFAFKGFVREAEVVEFTVSRRAPDMTFRQRLWLDKAGLPVKRVTTRTDDPQKAAETTESYEKISMEEVAEARFELEK